MSQERSWELHWRNRAIRDARRLSPDVKLRIIESLQRLATTGHGDVLQLQGRPGEWRLRVGQYRVIFVYEYEVGVIRVLRVLPRAQAYR